MSEGVEAAIKAEVDKHTAKLNAAHADRMLTLEREMAEKVENRARELTNRLLWAAAAVVGAVIGAAAFSMYGALREVNGQVIALQSGIISAQTAIRASESELTKQTATLAAANAAMVIKTRELEAKSRDLDEARARLAESPRR